MSWLRTVVKWALIAAGIAAGCVIALVMFLYAVLLGAGSFTP